MKRAFAAIVATVAGLVLLLGFKTHSARQSCAASTRRHGAKRACAADVGAQRAHRAHCRRSRRRPPAKPSAAAPAANTQTRTVTGSSIRTRYGNVQVQVNFTGTQITDVVPVRLPDSNDVDQEIDQQAVPILIQETLAAQSANIQAVSGATYTSDGYVRSLQSALDKAKVSRRRERPWWILVVLTLVGCAADHDADAVTASGQRAGTHPMSPTPSPLPRAAPTAAGAPSARDADSARQSVADDDSAVGEPDHNVRVLSAGTTVDGDRNRKSSQHSPGPHRWQHPWQRVGR